MGRAAAGQQQGGIMAAAGPQQGSDTEQAPGHVGASRAHARAERNDGAHPLMPEQGESNDCGSMRIDAYGRPGPGPSRHRHRARAEIAAALWRRRSRRGR